MARLTLLILLLLSTVASIARNGHGHACTSVAQCGVCERSLALAMKSNCPSDRWMDLVSPIIAGPSMVILNVGANKGFNVNSFLKRFQRGWNITNAAWHRHSPSAGCGACGACNSEVIKPTYGRANVYALAVEMASANYKNLQSLFATFKVPGDVIHAAGGEQPGVAYEPANLPLGTEHVGIAEKVGTFKFTDAAGKKWATPGIKIPMVTVDQIVAERKIESIDLLSIDTEGHDAPVLRGCAKTLEKRLAKTVEFEYHTAGAWGTGEKLDDTISMMRRYRYTCFWQSNAGWLSPFFPQCAAAYEFRQWSNVVCSTDPKVVTALNMLVPTDLQAEVA
mmetsp:Transcript_23042/g.65981  ORF Transcript_23042/g.65981 Transcript_23042/m.65981 type:complete len:336 (-) Transcript_23042:149-1156(-)